MHGFRNTDKFNFNWWLCNEVSWLVHVYVNFQLGVYWWETWFDRHIFDFVLEDSNVGEEKDDRCDYSRGGGELGKEKGKGEI